MIYVRAMQTPSPSILVADDDGDILDVFEQVLGDEGYATARAASLAEALACIDSETFDLVLSDSFSMHATAEPDGRGARTGSIITLLQHTMPTPVVVCSAWPHLADDLRQAGVAGFLSKPFDLATLLTTIAEALHADLISLQVKQAARIPRYFDALASLDERALTRLCASDLQFVAPRIVGVHAEGQPHICGLPAYLAYVAEMRTHFREPRFDLIRIHALPLRLAARYRLRWQGQDGTECAITGCATFAFEGQRIKQVSVTYNRHRVEALLR